MFPSPAAQSFTYTGAQLAARPTIMGKVLGLIGFAFLFTAGGALIGRQLGPPGFIVSLVGTFGTLIALAGGESGAANGGRPPRTARTCGDRSVLPCPGPIVERRWRMSG